MKIAHSVQKELRKLHAETALNLLNAMANYERNKRGDIMWLEQRPGYRLKYGNFRVIFELRNEEIFALRILTGITE